MKRITLTLGANISFGGFKAGCWETISDGKGNVTHQHKSAIYENVEVTDAVCEGLLATAASWKKSNGTHVAPLGDVRRMLLVTDVVDAGPDPKPALSVVGTEVLKDFTVDLAQAIREGVTAAMEDALNGPSKKAATKKTTPKPSDDES